MKKVFWLLMFAATVFISACGGGGGGGGGGSANTATVNGVVSKGPLNAATVCAYAITGGAKGAAIGTCATTDANGNYSIDLGAYAGPVLLEAAGGSYVDEATGATVALAQPLHSMQTNAAGSTSAAVTALTELAYKQASTAAGGLTNTNIQAAISNVQANFGVADIVNTQPVDALNLPATATAAQKTYALALAAISQYQQPAGTSLDNSLQEMQACLAAPLTGCGTGTASVGVRLNEALATFQAAHPAFSGMPSLMSKFGSQPTDSLVKYDTVTVAGLNRRNQKGTLGLYNDVGNTLSIQTDGTYTFATPLTAAARIHTLSVQPSGNACAFTKNRIDVIDPYMEQLISQNTAEIYCYESPCGSINSLGQAPAPKGLKVTKNPDSTVSFSWQKDAWANGYRIYYGTSLNVVTTDPMTGFTVFQNELPAAWSYNDTPSKMTVPPNTTYYYAITSTYLSPANLDSCQSKASVSVMATAPSPTITGMSPGTGAVGTTVTITGTNFSTTPANNTVKFNGTTATVTAATATSLTVTVPSGAITGTVTVTTAGVTVTSTASFTVSGSVPGGSTIMLACNMPTYFTCQEYYVANSGGCGAAPEIQTVSSCAAANPTSVLIGTCSVSGNLKTYSYSGYPLSDAQSVCSMMSGTWSATGAVVVPTVTGITPSSGAVGSSVTISGTGFDSTPSNNRVLFNGLWLATVTQASATFLTVTVPGAATTTGAVSVSTKLGGDAATTVNFAVITVDPLYQSAYDSCFYIYGATYCSAFANAIVAGSTPTAANQAGAAASGMTAGLVGVVQGPLVISGTPNTSYSLSGMQYEVGGYTSSSSSVAAADVIDPSTGTLLIAKGTIQTYSSVQWRFYAPLSAPQQSCSVMMYYNTGISGTNDEDIEVSIFAPGNLLFYPGPSVGNTFCSVTGANLLKKPTCASWGVTANRAAGTITFTSTPVRNFTGAGGAGVINGSLSFIPF